MTPWRAGLGRGSRAQSQEVAGVVTYVPNHCTLPVPPSNSSAWPLGKAALWETSREQCQAAPQG